MQGSRNSNLFGIIGTRGMMMSRRRWCAGEVSKAPEDLGTRDCILEAAAFQCVFPKH